MSDLTQTDPPAPKPAKKRRKAKRVKAVKPATVPAAAKDASPFVGLTRKDCAAGCSVNGCVVSGKAYCGHPTKGGLQAEDKGNYESIRRFDQAMKHLKRQEAA